MSYLNVERGYTADEASNALLTLNLGEVCGRLMGTVFVTLLPLLRARRRVPRASATKTIIAPKTTGASDSDTTKDKSTAATTPTATATATSHKKDLLHRALSFSNVFVSSFLLNCVLLTSYCLLGFLHRDSVLFAPFGYAILIVYGLFYGVIMTLVLQYSICVICCYSI